MVLLFRGELTMPQQGLGETEHDSIRSYDDSVA